jgi:hypothetical protein
MTKGKRGRQGRRPMMTQSKAWINRNFTLFRNDAPRAQIAAATKRRAGRQEQ